jgi:hypothetical protein
VYIRFRVEMLVRSLDIVSFPISSDIGVAKSGTWLGARYMILRFLRKVVEPHKFDTFVRFRRAERSAGTSAHRGCHHDEASLAASA